MNKEKLKHLPINIYCELSTWFIPFLFLTSFTKMNIWGVVAISTYIYLKVVIKSVDIDYLEERIKKLESVK